MSIGVSRETFFRSTLANLEDYDDAYRLRRKIDDERDYYLGVYIYEALRVVIGNVFRSKGAKPEAYRDKPFIQEMEEQERLLNPTEEEKQQHIDNLFAMLGQMQANFERTHGGE